MIIPDVNLLVYAYNRDSPFHEPAARWWTECLSGTAEVGLPSVVALGFVRVTTQARVLACPLELFEAAALVRSWLERPGVCYLECTAETLLRTLALLEAARGGANLVTDAQIAALALEHRAVVHTADADFARFPGLRWRNPVA